jgi:broad specificity phosphatase PhoE
MIVDAHRLGRNPTKEEIEQSRNVRDPPLTDFGQQACLWYRSVLPARLRAIGVDPHASVLGSSRLLRAQETAKDLFPGKDLVIFSSLGENGAVPENTPRGMQYRPPSWEGFLRELHALAIHEGATDFIVVAHGSFIRQSISAILGEQVPPLSNLDGYALGLTANPDGTLSSGRVLSLPFPKEEYESDGGIKAGLSFPSIPSALRGWRTLMEDLCSRSF